MTHNHFSADETCIFKIRPEHFGNSTSHIKIDKSTLPPCDKSEVYFIQDGQVKGPLCDNTKRRKKRDCCDSSSFESADFTGSNMDIVYSGGKFKFSFNFEFEWELLPGLPEAAPQDDWNSFMDETGYTDFGNHQKPSYDGNHFNVELVTPPKYTKTVTTTTSTTTTSTTATTTTPCPGRDYSEGDKCQIPPAPSSDCPWTPETSGDCQAHPGYCNMKFMNVCGLYHFRHLFCESCRWTEALQLVPLLISKLVPLGTYKSPFFPTVFFSRLFLFKSIIRVKLLNHMFHLNFAHLQNQTKN